PRMTNGEMSGERVAGALIAALFFAIHPLRAESVAWITERRDMLSGFFSLLTVLVYLRCRARGARRRLLYSGLFLLAVLSKATAVGVIGMLIAIDVLRWRSWINAAVDHWPMLVVGAAAGLINLEGFRTGALVVGTYGAWDRLL